MADTTEVAVIGGGPVGLSCARELARSGLDVIQGGTFHARDGFLDPAGFVAALLDDARRLGATVLADAAVETIDPGFRIRHARGELHADRVVNAAGAHARAIARLGGSDVPVEPV